jgi:GT2 family glycosyltransferase
MRLLLRLFLLLLAAVLLLPLLLLNALSLALVDLMWWLFGRRAEPAEPERSPASVAAGAAGQSACPAYSRPTSLSVVIPTWNGRDLLEKFLPSVVRAAGFHPDNEVIVVDNASEDGTEQYVRQVFPQVRVLRFNENLGFGGGNNAGVRAARNDVVVVLNNDMRVEPDCFERLIEGFTDAEVFAVSAQIFFLDGNKRREETGLTEGRFENGFFRFGHLAEDVASLYPTFYAGGGSSAYHRAKYLELGGFDDLFHPFYVEDADLSYNAWKRGWKVLYQPAAVVHHEHRGTIGRRFTARQIEAILKKNHILMVWKNVHNWGRLAEHFFFTYSGALLSLVFPPSPQRTTLAGYTGALRGWGTALGRRWRARNGSVISDREARLRPLPAFYRDRFCPPPYRGDDQPLHILFLCPYSIYPPTHGGGVFMYQAVRRLARRHRVHVLAFVDNAEEAEQNHKLEGVAASVRCLVRTYPPPLDFLGTLPYSVRCFISPEFERLVHRTIWERQIDVVQVEYTQLGHFAGGWRHTPTLLFEHDVYFQTTRRALGRAASAGERARSFVEWLRAIRYELRLLRRMDLVETCSEKERRLLESFLGPDATPVRGDLRSAIEVGDYRPVFGGREPDTLLFVGNFRHAPNLDGLRFLVGEVLPGLRASRPRAELVVAGSHPTPQVESLCCQPGVRLLGMVPEIREVLARYALFLAPIFTGSGVRVKILEAFAAGIPVISTPLGAEGLDVAAGRDLLFARDARQFISAIMELLDNPGHAEALARSARGIVERRYAADEVLERLEQAYRGLLRHKAAALSSGDSLVASSPRFS